MYHSGVLGAEQPARGMEHLKLLKVPNLLGRVCPNNLVHLSLLLLSKPRPFSSPLTARKPLRLLTFPLSQSGWMWIPVVQKWPESQSLKHSACPSSPTPRAPHSVGFCSQSRPPGLVFSSLRLPPPPCSISLPPTGDLGWGKGLGPARLRLLYVTLFCEVCSNCEVCMQSG